MPNKQSSHLNFEHNNIFTPSWQKREIQKQISEEIITAKNSLIKFISLELNIGRHISLSLPQEVVGNFKFFLKSNRISVDLPDTSLLAFAQTLYPKLSETILKVDFPRSKKTNSMNEYLPLLFYMFRDNKDLIGALSSLLFDIKNWSFSNEQEFKRKSSQEISQILADLDIKKEIESNPLQGINILEIGGCAMPEALDYLGANYFSVYPSSHQSDMTELINLDNQAVLEEKFCKKFSNQQTAQFDAVLTSRVFDGSSCYSGLEDMGPRHEIYNYRDAYLVSEKELLAIIYNLLKLNGYSINLANFIAKPHDFNLETIAQRQQFSYQVVILQKKHFLNKEPILFISGKQLQLNDNDKYQIISTRE